MTVNIQWNMRQRLAAAALAALAGTLARCSSDGGPAPVSPPESPSALAAAAVSSSQIDLSWTDNASNEEGFKIERCTGLGCGDFVEIGAAGPNAASFESGGLTGGTAYAYRVRAYSGAGNSGYSNTATATTGHRQTFFRRRFSEIGG